MLSDHAVVEIGLGTGEIAVGDQLDIFRPGDLVVDPSTGRNMGHLTVQLGWLGGHGRSRRDRDGSDSTVALRDREGRPRDAAAARTAEVPIGDRVEIEGSSRIRQQARRWAAATSYLNRGSSQAS
jgi:hypothetical protein